MDTSSTSKFSDRYWTLHLHVNSWRYCTICMEKVQLFICSICRKICVTAFYSFIIVRCWSQRLGGFPPNWWLSCIVLISCRRRLLPARCMPWRNSTQERLITSDFFDWFRVERADIEPRVFPGPGARRTRIISARWRGPWTRVDWPVDAWRLGHSSVPQPVQWPGRVLGKSLCVPKIVCPISGTWIALNSGLRTLDHIMYKELLEGRLWSCEGTWKNSLIHMYF